MILLVFVVCFVWWLWWRSLDELRPITKPTMTSLVGMAFASCSALLAVGAVCYSGAIGGFAFYAPSLMRIYAWGFLLSLIALFVSSIGLFFRNPLRWEAPAAASTTLLFWFLCAATE